MRTLTFLLLLVISACELGEQEAVLGAALDEALAREAPAVDLATLLPFGWDAMYLFDPYTSLGDVCDRLELGWLDCLFDVGMESMNDTEHCIVFTHQGRVVHAELYHRLHGDFLPLDFPQPVVPVASRFAVTRFEASGGGRPWYRLTWVPGGAAFYPEPRP